MKAPILAVCGALAPFVFACGAPERPAAPAAAPVPAATTPPAAAQSANDYAVPGEFPCTPLDDIKFVRGMVSPEDIAVFPGGAWAIASATAKVAGCISSTCGARPPRRSSSTRISASSSTPSAIPRAPARSCSRNRISSRPTGCT